MAPPSPRRVALSLLLAGLPPLLAWSPLGAQQRWTLTPELRIGSVDDPRTALTRIGDIAVGEDGTMYVSQPQQREIRIYSRAGELLRVVGGEGGGPGEFQNVSSLFWRGDTLLVLDFAQQRFSLFARDGEFIRTFRPLPRGAIVMHLVSAQFPDGSVFARVRSGGRGGSSPLLRISGPGAPDTLAWVRLDSPIRVSRGGRVLQMLPPFRQGDRSDVARRADAVTVVAQPPAESADSGFFIVSRIDPGGRSRFERRFRYAPRPISTRDLEGAKERLLDLGGLAVAPELRRELIRHLEEDLEIPPFHAPVSALVSGRDGTTWLRLHEGESRHQWLVLDERGDVLARLSVPAALRILNADREHVWGMELDALDVPYLIRYRVRSTR